MQVCSSGFGCGDTEYHNIYVCVDNCGWIGKCIMLGTEITYIQYINNPLKAVVTDDSESEKLGIWLSKMKDRT